MIGISHLNTFLINLSRDVSYSYKNNYDQLMTKLLLQTSTRIGLKEGYGFLRSKRDGADENESFISLTQDVNPDWENRIDQRANSEVLTDTNNAPLLFDGSVYLHESPFKEWAYDTIKEANAPKRNDVSQTGSDYNLSGTSISDNNNITESLLNETSGSSYGNGYTGYSPTRVVSVESATVTDYINSVAGKSNAVGDYPFRIIGSGTPKAVLQTLDYLEGQEGPYGIFGSVVDDSWTSLPSFSSYEPNGGVAFSSKDGLISIISPFGVAASPEVLK